VTSARLVHKATDALPDAAWQVMISGFRGRKTYSQITKELLALGFRVPERTVARRAIDWRAEQLRREVMQAVGTEATQADLLEEVVDLVQVLDVRPGWAIRARRRVQKAVTLFYNEPVPEQARQVKLELTRFCLERFYANARAVGAIDRSGEGKGPGANYAAGDAGGGYDERSNR